jgi:hypothetical protein
VISTKTEEVAGTSVSLHLDLLINPGLSSRSPLDDALREPKSDFLVSGLNRVGTVADVATDVNAVVSTDGSGGGLAGLRGTEELSALNGGVVTLPDHSEDGRGLHELNETTEERLALQIGVVSLEVSLRWLDELHGDKLETLLLETRDDGSAEVSLDAVRLDHDESSILVGAH